MIEIKGNIWTTEANWKGITTNGHVDYYGRCVMGRGIAKQAKDRFNELPHKIGAAINKFGNNVFWFPEYQLFSFPVKHHWNQKADIDLIKKSAEQLAAVADTTPNETFILARPGCGNGHLTWEEVKLGISFLPDNVKIVDIRG